MLVTFERKKRNVGFKKRYGNNANAVGKNACLQWHFEKH